MGTSDSTCLECTNHVPWIWFPTLQGREKSQVPILTFSWDLPGLLSHRIHQILTSDWTQRSLYTVSTVWQTCLSSISRWLIFAIFWVNSWSLSWMILLWWLYTWYILSSNFSVRSETLQKVVKNYTDYAQNFMLFFLKTWFCHVAQASLEFIGLPVSASLVLGLYAHRWAPPSQFLCFRWSVSCSWDWPWTCYVVEAGFELLTLVLSPKSWEL